jgi:hypothetical protein
MSLQGIPGMSESTIRFVQMVRLYLRDFPELNRIVRGPESSDRMIAWAVLDALSDFNGTPPFLGTFDLDYLLSRGQQALMLRMTVCTLLESIGLLQTRNHVNYSDGGLNTAVHDKTPLIMQWLNLFRSTSEQMKLKVKVSMNIETLLGPGNHGVYSEYWVVNGSYLTL